MSINKILLATALCAAASAATAAPASVEELTNQFLAALDQLPGYQVEMTKLQRIRGRLQPEETILLKQRRDPPCVYMKWIEKPNLGRELIHCPARYEGKVKVHAGGRKNIATLSLDPEGPVAMLDNLHPVTRAGIYEIGRTLQALRSEVATLTPSAGGRASCLTSNAQWSAGAYRVGRSEICFDNNVHHLPVSLRLWDANGQLMEQYSYFNYRLNLRLSDQDFNVRNRMYDF